MRKVKFTALVFLLIISAFTISQIHFDISVEELKKTYANEASQFMEIGGMQVHYRDEGKGEIIILIHGTAASLHTWDAWANELKKTHRVIRLDLPAFGLTGPHPQHNYSITMYVDVLHRLVEKLNLNRFALAGNSLGGNIAWNYAADYPQETEKLILLDPSGYPSEGKRPWVFDLAETPILNSVIKYFTPRSFIHNNLKQVYFEDSKITEELVARYHKMTLREGNRDAFIARAKTQYVDNSAKLSKITAPTLILWGKEDIWIPPTLGKKFQQQIPNSILVIMENVGHIPMEESPQESLEIVKRFLKK